MELEMALRHRSDVEEFQRRHRIGLVTLLFTDIVGSTELKRRWGDPEALALIQQHHTLVKNLVGRFPEGEQISTSGDSCFLVFTKPSDAVKFSLLLQGELQGRAQGTGRPVFDRIGIHVGEVFIEERESEAVAKDLYGIQVDTCARIMSLGRESQILMSRFAFDNARQVIGGQSLEGARGLAWLNHGLYLLKGFEEPVEICEVGEQGRAALTPPGSSDKAQRFLTGQGEPVLGWRPAVDQLVPGTNWILQEKLGEGGFGEVWLGWHEILKERKVFKFCFRADRVRSLKREVTLFRLLRERVKDHPNILGIHEVYFDEPPYYIVMDYAGGKDLAAWCAARGGVAAVPLGQRLEIVAQVAAGLQSAHEAGIIHRDIKPSNILLLGKSGEPGAGEVKLTDFGIGRVVSAEALEGLTRMGFTQTMVSSASSHTGTLLYMAPELLAGKTALPQSDIYSLGVVLFQLLVADFSRPLTMDWMKSVDDQLLQEDLLKCFAGDPGDRFASAADLARNLRNMEQRRREDAARQEAVEARKRRAYLLGFLRRAALLLLFLAFLGAAAYVAKDLVTGRHGSLEVQTYPAGAEVWLDGRRAGVTPYAVERLLPGIYACRLALTNYEAFETAVAIAARNHSQLMAFLTQEPAPESAVAHSASAETNAMELVVATPAAATMTLVHIEGEVQVLRRRTTEWVPASPDLVLRFGDRVRTGLLSSALVRNSDGSILRLAALTTLEVKAPGPDALRLFPPLIDPGLTNRIRIFTPQGSAVIRG